MKIVNNNNFHYIHRISKRTIPFFKKNNRFDMVVNSAKYDNQTNQWITKKLLNNEPLMVGRLGSTETRSMIHYRLSEKKLNDFSGVYNLLTGQSPPLEWWYREKYLERLCTLSGFFPKDKEYFGKFVDLMESCVQDVDLLGVWNGFEEFVPQINPNAKLCKIRSLEPWFFGQPWTKVLESKRVLVIHPFEDSIRSQYENNRENIYKDKNVLPKFELKTIKAVQTIADEKSNFADWFEALESMKEKIDQTEFDIAIIGCGAYGFPLATYIKSIGKKAVHLGGVTQLLFGIKGKRWEDWSHYTSLRGDGWIDAMEKPKGFEKVEDGCYW